MIAPLIKGIGIGIASITTLATLVGGGISLGKQAEAIAGAKKDIVKIEVNVEKERDINVMQTVALKEQAVILKQVVKALDKVVDKLNP